MTKEERRIYDQAYRKSNKEKMNKYRRGWCARNREKIRIQNKFYRNANPEKVKAMNKAYRQAHKEERKAYNKVYYDTNPDKERARKRAYRKANSNKLREYDRKRRALKHTTQVELINEKMVFIRDGWICQHCKKRVDKTLKYPDPMSRSLDHIVPLSKGGTHTYKNVQLAHFGCNTNKRHGILAQGEQLRMF